jgi:hypothetical protein
MEVKYDRTLGIDASLGLSVNVTGGAPLLKVETEVGVTVTHSPAIPGERQNIDFP